MEILRENFRWSHLRDSQIQLLLNLCLLTIDILSLEEIRCRDCDFCVRQLGAA